MRVRYWACLVATLVAGKEGKYPADKFTSILRGQTSLMAHGDQQMPV